MGALHAGHLSLVERARSQSARVAVSIFVNPTQFGPNEDYTRYPRPVERDLDLCRSSGVDLVFAPGVAEMYPPGVTGVVIDLPVLTSTLEGRHRPGHFVGVCTVVAKLLNIVRPAAAFFGEKDFQQLAVIRGMVRALDVPCRVVGCPTLRDADGLAMSSRNQYLSADERIRGLSISRSLRAVQDRFAAGERDAHRLRGLLHSILEDDTGAKGVPTELQYATIIDETTLAEIDQVDSPARAVVAMKVGNTRLIDNMALERRT